MERTGVSDTTKLEPCPWCSDDLSSFVPSKNGCCRGELDGEDAFAVCCDCGAVGPMALTVEQAIAAWNRRRASPEATPGQSQVPDGWVAVSERLPAHDGEVLIYHILGDSSRSEVPRAYDIAAYMQGKWVFPWDRGDLNNPPRWVTYWRELPPPPREGNDTSLQQAKARTEGGEG